MSEVEARNEEKDNMPIESEQQDAELVTEGEELTWQVGADQIGLLGNL